MNIEVTAISASAFDGLLAAPTTLDFNDVAVDGFGVSHGDSPRVFGGWTVSLVDSNGNDFIGLDDSLTVTANNASDLWNGAGDKLIVNGEFGVVSEAVHQWRRVLAAALCGLEPRRGRHDHRFTGGGLPRWDAGASQDFTAPLNQALTINLIYGADPDWLNIDELRIVQQNGAAAHPVPYRRHYRLLCSRSQHRTGVANLNGDSTSFTEGGSPVLLGTGGNDGGR